MPELLLELRSEEIPARMQARASDDLRRLILAGLAEAGLSHGEAEAFATPRRLVLVIDDLATKSATVVEERKGPRLGAPDKAIEGFLRAAGLKSVDEAEVVSDPKKGNYYVARTKKPGRKAADIIAGVVPDVMQSFPWPKSMRWGDGSFQWVRPLRGIVCLLGGRVVKFEVAGVASGAETVGHRFHSQGTIKVRDFNDYVKGLKKNRVILDSEDRAELIAEKAAALAKEAKLSLIEDPSLLSENAGLTEWPVPLLGTFDEAFLDVPAECLVTAMKSHQKCFSLQSKRSKKLANKFIAVANLKARDGGKQIIAGNEKVINARLADAKFFWEQDLKKPLDEMAMALSAITFHEMLGSQQDRVERIADLAHDIAVQVDADADDARRAAQLAKADLVSGMVGEFPELQGLMGRYYAEKVGTKPEIARAIELHYKPQGPKDAVPMAAQGDAVAIAVALADKLDTLVGFWAIDEKPTGSGDPYQLRRAALGVIRIILENDLRLGLHGVVQKAVGSLKNASVTSSLDAKAIADSLLSFFADRLKVHLRDQGLRHDLIDAVFALDGQDDLALIVKRVEALAAFLETDDGINLLAGVKRAANILAIEEKKDGRRYDGDVDGGQLKEPAERDLAAAIAKVQFDTDAAINVENFSGAMHALAELRAPVDAFFETVTVNADTPALRENRLTLLNQIRTTTYKIANLAKVSG
jgi:glycyl-tRNA synthetase beta chain